MLSYPHRCLPLLLAVLGPLLGGCASRLICDVGATVVPKPLAAVPATR